MFPPLPEDLRRIFNTGRGFHTMNYMNKKIGIYGGSFNPIHYGHLKTGQYLVDHNYVDEILYVVNPCSPFKKGDKIPDVYFRLKMVEDAAKEFEKKEHEDDHGIYFRSLWASNYEATQFFGKDVYYTVDTLRLFLYSDVFEDNEIYFILGVDTFNDIKKFKDWKWLLETKLVRLLILPRKGYALYNSIYNEFKEIATYVDDAPYIEMSSTEVRELFKQKKYEELKEFLPKTEIDYIIENRLYE